MSSKHRCRCFSKEFNSFLHGLRREAPSTERIRLERMVNILSRAAAVENNNPQRLWAESERPAWWRDVTNLPWKNPREHPKDNKVTLKQKISVLQMELDARGLMTAELREEVAMYQESKTADLELKSDLEVVISKAAGLHYMLESVLSRMRRLRRSNRRVTTYIRECKTCLEKSLGIVNELHEQLQAEDRRKTSLWTTMGVVRNQHLTPLSPDLTVNDEGLYRELLSPKDEFDFPFVASAITPESRSGSLTSLLSTVSPEPLVQDYDDSVAPKETPNISKQGLVRADSQKPQRFAKSPLLADHVQEPDLRSESPSFVSSTHSREHIAISEAVVWRSRQPSRCSVPSSDEEGELYFRMDVTPSTQPPEQSAKRFRHVSDPVQGSRLMRKTMMDPVLGSTQRSALVDDHLVGSAQKRAAMSEPVLPVKRNLLATSDIEQLTSSIENLLSLGEDDDVKQDVKQRSSMPRSKHKESPETFEIPPGTLGIDDDNETLDTVFDSVFYIDSLDNELLLSPNLDDIFTRAAEESSETQPPPQGHVALTSTLDSSDRDVVDLTATVADLIATANRGRNPPTESVRQSHRPPPLTSNTSDDKPPVATNVKDRVSPVIDLTGDPTSPVLTNAGYSAFHVMGKPVGLQSYAVEKSRDQPTLLMDITSKWRRGASPPLIQRRRSASSVKFVYPEESALHIAVAAPKRPRNRLDSDNNNNDEWVALGSGLFPPSVGDHPPRRRSGGRQDLSQAIGDLAAHFKH